MVRLAVRSRNCGTPATPATFDFYFPGLLPGTPFDVPEGTVFDPAAGGLFDAVLAARIPTSC